MLPTPQRPQKRIDRIRGSGLLCALIGHAGQAVGQAAQLPGLTGTKPGDGTQDVIDGSVMAGQHRAQRRLLCSPARRCGRVQRLPQIAQQRLFVDVHVISVGRDPPAHKRR